MGARPHQGWGFRDTNGAWSSTPSGLLLQTQGRQGCGSDGGGESQGPFSDAQPSFQGSGRQPAPPHIHQRPGAVLRALGTAEGQWRDGSVLWFLPRAGRRAFQGHREQSSPGSDEEPRAGAFSLAQLSGGHPLSGGGRASSGGLTPCCSGVGTGAWPEEGIPAE